jgi:HK97 family phage prohead protease
MAERREAPIEVRARAGRKLEGYAALFDVETRITDPDRGGFREIIRAGAFSNDLNRDILFLADHDPARLLGRTKSGTLRLASDTKGLHFEADVPDTQLGRDMLALAERGDLGGMSFGFDVPQGGDTWTGDLRELRAIRLFEISAIQAFAAYPQTTVHARSMPAGRPALTLRQRYIQTLTLRD